jgi:hypothetical protein
MQLLRASKRTAICLTILLLSGATSLASGATPSPKVATAGRFYGTATRSVLSISSAAFSVASNAIGWTRDEWSLTGGGGQFSASAPVQLPNGASIEAVEVLGCGPVVIYLTSVGSDLTPIVHDDAYLSAPFTSECGVAHFEYETPLVVENGAKFINAIARGAGQTGFYGLRVFYRLNVSPAPATATFGDVPVGDPCHRFIEALAAAGITGGCGGGNFCPDAPLTRKQMAVFMAVALGLHFPN